MLPTRRMPFILFLFILHIHFATSSSISNKSTIIIQTPDQTSTPTESPHKSIHVKYVPNEDNEQFYITGFEPQIQIHEKVIEQITVHLCHVVISQTIWYDDSNVCEPTHSMLIYEWTSSTTLAPFRLPDQTGIVYDRSKSLILSVVYRHERQTRKQQSSIVLNISTQPTRFRIGTILAGDPKQGTRFSCRSSTIPRLLYGVKKLMSNKDLSSWRIHLIRSRQFGRKLVQTVLDSNVMPTRNQTDVDIVESDLFLVSGDYLLIECDNVIRTHCYFLIYFMYKAKSTEYEEACDNNEFPKLFELTPSKKANNVDQRTVDLSDIDGSTILWCILGFLLFIWISTIIGCVIRRRIYHLVNYRTEPISSLSAQKSKLLANGRRGPSDGAQARTETDQVLQADGEHGGTV